MEGKVNYMFYEVNYVFDISRHISFKIKQIVTKNQVTLGYIKFFGQANVCLFKNTFKQ